MLCATKFQGDTFFSLEEFLQQLVQAFWGALAGIGVIFADKNRQIVIARRADVAHKFFLICIAVCFKGQTKLLVNSYSYSIILLKKSKTESFFYTGRCSL